MSALIAFFESSKYLLIFAGSFVEGAVVMMTTGILWHLGTVDFWPAFLALLVGDILADTMWYFIGYYGARSLFDRYGRWFGITPENTQKVERRFRQYHLKILIVSKLTMGFGLSIPILTVAGMMRVPYARFLAVNTVGGIVWIFLLMVVGYHFGNLLSYIPDNMRVALTIVAALTFAFALRELNKQLKTIDW